MALARGEADFSSLRLCEPVALLCQALEQCFLIGNTLRHQRVVRGGPRHQHHARRAVAVSREFPYSHGRNLTVRANTLSLRLLRSGQGGNYCDSAKPEKFSSTADGCG